MNVRLVARLLGILVLVIGLSMVFTLMWASALGEDMARRAALASMIICLVSGGALLWIGRGATIDRLLLREGMSVVALGWILAAVLGALPFILSGAIPDPIDAFFETMSGFTTTGSSILVDVEAMPKSLLFWRSFTQWLGGIGIIVLFIAILPQMGVGARHLFRSEIPGVAKDGMSPRIKDTAVYLIGVYSTLTVALFVILMVQGMTFLDSLCHTFSTVATGGFSSRNGSIGAFDSVTVDVTIVVFMLFAGTNFSLYLLLLRTRRHRLRVFRDVEWRVYMSVLAAGTIAITFDLVGSQSPPSVAEAARQALFQVAAVETTTGFGTADFNTWPPFSKALLILFMFAGGSAGSTSGGMKLMRVILVIRFVYNEIYRAFRPHGVRLVRVRGSAVGDDVMHSVLAYFVIFIGLFGAGSIVMTLLGFDLISATSAVLAALGNVGPGLGLVGPTSSYASVPDAGKLMLSGFMLLGRLEFFTLMVLFVPAFWRR